MIVHTEAHKAMASAATITQNSGRLLPSKSSPMRRDWAQAVMTKFRPMVHYIVTPRITRLDGPTAEVPTAETRIPAGTTGGEPSESPPSDTTLV